MYNSRLLSFVTSLLLALTVSAVDARTDDEIATDIVARLRSNVSGNYVFNTVTVSSENGKVVLSGKVRDAYIFDRAQKAAEKIEGVVSIDNQIQVLPVSIQDDRLRAIIYRRLSNDGLLFAYFLGRDPGIQIIVENSRVTLLGQVNNNVERVRAGSRIRELSGVLRVDNQIKVVRG